MAKKANKKIFDTPFADIDPDKEIPLPGDGLPPKNEAKTSDKKETEEADIPEKGAHQTSPQEEPDEKHASKREDTKTSHDKLHEGTTSERTEENAKKPSISLHREEPLEREGFLPFLRAEGRWRWWFLYLIGTYLVVFEKLKFASVYAGFRIDWTKVWENWHIALLNNKGGAPNQYRMLSTVLAESMHQFGLSAFTSYIILRFVCLFATCLVLHYFWRRWLRDEECFFGVALFLLFSMMSLLPLIQPAEPLNVLMFACCTLFLVEKRWVPFYVCLCLGALNKLTLVFLAPLVFFYLLLEPQTRDRQTIQKAFLHACLTGGMALGIRFALVGLLGQHKYYTSFWKIGENINWMRTSPAGWNFVLIAIVPMLLIWMSWKKQPRFVQAHSLMLPFFTVGHFSITLVSEVRTFIITLCVSIPALLLWMRTEPKTSKEPDGESP